MDIEITTVIHLWSSVRNRSLMHVPSFLGSYLSNIGTVLCGRYPFCCRANQQIIPAVFASRYKPLRRVPYIPCLSQQSLSNLIEIRPISYLTLLTLVRASCRWNRGQPRRYYRV